MVSAEKAQEKAQKEPVITVQRELYNSTVILALKSIGENPELYRAELQNGRLENHVFYVDGVLSYVLILRVDDNRDGSRDLVCMHGVSMHPRDGVNVTKALFPYLKKLAREAGFQRVRNHTSLNSMAKVLTNAGFKAMETVYVFEVDNEQ